MKKTFKTFALMLLTAFAFSSCVDVPAPFGLPEKDSNTEGGTTGTKVEPKGDGTAASPFNVAAAVAKIKEMEPGVESTEEYYIKGKVLAVTTTAETIKQYGNHTFTMVDEGDNSTVFTAFQVYGPGKQKFTLSSDTDACYDSYPLTEARAGREVYCVVTDCYGVSVKSEIAVMGLLP